MRGARCSRDVLPAGTRPAVGDVVFDRVVEEHGVLRHDSDGRPQAGLRDRAHVLTVDQDPSRADLVEPEQQPRERRLAGTGRADDGSRRPARDREVHVEQHLAPRVVGEVHMLEPHLGGPDLERARAGFIGDLAVLLEQQEHAVHVGQALLDLAVDDAEEVHRNVELDHEGVDQHQVADRHPALDDPERRAPQDQRQRNRDDRLLPRVQHVQRLLRQHGGALAVGQRVVVASRLVLLVAEILDRFEIQKRVDRARVGPRLELVPATAYLGPPVRDRHGEQDVDAQAGADDRREPDLVVPDQVGDHQRDLDQRRQDRIQREADQR